MTISATSVRFDEHTMWVELTDGRTLGVPLAWFPRLLRATPAEREQVELSRVGLHWEAIDEDISIAGLLAGRAAEWGRKTARKGILLDFLLASPLRGANLDLERQHDSPRDRPDSHPQRCQRIDYKAPSPSLRGALATTCPPKLDERRRIAVGTLIAERPPHRTVRAAFPHTAPTSGE